MELFLVEGGQALKGDFVPAGNKNEALPVLAATLLTSEKVVLENLPDISDVNTMKSLLQMLGVRIQVGEAKKTIFSAKDINLSNANPDQELAKKIRGSFLLVAPLLYRFQKVQIPHPGGDFIGRRRLDTHFLALERLGASIESSHHFFTLECKEFKGAYIFLDEASVMATETAIMAASIAKGETVIYNAACEPHVQGLCRLLISMGAKIEGVGSNLLKIEGQPSLSGAEYSLQSDHIEIGSIIGLAAVTHSEITIKNAAKVDLGLIPLFFDRLGVSFHYKDQDLIVPAKQELIVKKESRLQTPKIDDSPWPGFPADLLSIMLVVASQAEGSVLIFEKLFESRLFWVDRLISMGARVILCDPHRALVNGANQLYADKIISPDIRAGMALLIAAMCAQGTSEILNVEQIDRGYEQIDKRLNALGAKIQRISN